MNNRSNLIYCYESGERPGLLSLIHVVCIMAKFLIEYDIQFCLLQCVCVRHSELLSCTGPLYTSSERYKPRNICGIGCYMAPIVVPTVNRQYGESKTGLATVGATIFLFSHHIIILCIKVGSIPFRQHG